MHALLFVQALVCMYHRARDTLKRHTYWCSKTVRHAITVTVTKPFYHAWISTRDCLQMQAKAGVKF